MISPVEKNKEYVVDIVDNGFEGEGIAKIDGFTIFIPNAIKGEKIRILIVKVLSSHAFGKIIEIIEKSEHRIEEDCTTYKRCGGCNLRHIDYEETLNMKQRAVQNLVNKTLKNKIAKYLTELINKYKISVYNETTQKGLVRHVVIKTGFRSREVMVILVVNGDELPFAKEISKELQEKYEEIKSIVININNKNTNVILGEKNINILGDGYIKDYLGEYCFKISPLSFYQVNPVQAEALYNIAIENVNITPDDVVFDLYCGIGTISLFAAKYAKKVYGIEIVEQAIENAIENAKINDVNNTEFIAGDTELLLTDLIKNKKIIPDVVIVDPPRKGLDNTTINNILKIEPKRVGYISCNPATFVRDLSKLEEKYKIKMIQPVDMFPFTSSIENVGILELR